jgi:hypothetical protein
MMRSDFDQLTAEIHVILSRKYAQKMHILPEKWCTCSNHHADVIATPTVTEEIIDLLRKKLNAEELEDFTNQFPALESLEDLSFRCVSQRLLVSSLRKTLFPLNRLQMQ